MTKAISPPRTPSPTDDFINVLRQMFAEDEYLIPYAWAQRKFRDDNYSMQSQGLLEDMFYDTLGHFLNRRGRGNLIERRTGRESWDYRYAGTGFSHKESSTFLFTAVWQPGEGKGNATPKHPTWTFEHNIVLSYFPKTTRATFQWQSTAPSGKTRKYHTGACLLNDHTLKHALASSRAAHTFVLISRMNGDDIVFEHVLSVDEWQRESLGSLKGRLGDEALTSTCFWITQPTKALISSGFNWFDHGPTLRVSLSAKPFFPGIYVIPAASLRDVPMQSNNKAHFPTPEFVRKQMTDAAASQRFIYVPRWPDVFANTVPPNLYQQIRNEYDALFRARTSP